MQYTKGGADGRAWWISSFNLFPVIGDWISNLLLSIEIPEKFLALREMRDN